MKKIYLAALLLLFSSACSTSDTRPASAPLRKVRVSMSPLLSWGPLMIARQEGFFRDEGLDVEFVSTLSSQEELVALVTGDIDVQPGPLHAGFLSAIAQGAKIRIVAGQGALDKNGCTYFGIVRRGNIDPSQIKRVRASHDGVSRFIASQMLKHEGIDIEHLEVVKLPDAVLARTLEAGSVDAVAASEPTLTRLVKETPLWLSAEKVLPDYQWGILAFGERLLYRDRDTGARFLRAYSRGVAQYRKGKTDRNVGIIAGETGEDAALIRDACWLPFREDLRVNWKSIDEFQTWANAQGIMEHTVTFSQAMDTTFLHEIISDSNAH
jgi:NitT/TauT family transport system substrate-binding protein